MQPYVCNLQPCASQVERAASLQQSTALLRHHTGYRRRLAAHAARRWAAPSEARRHALVVTRTPTRTLPLTLPLPLALPVTLPLALTLILTLTRRAATRWSRCTPGRGTRRTAAPTGASTRGAGARWARVRCARCG